MLSNSEFAQFSGIHTPLEEDMASFAMFSLNLGEYHENGQVMFPHLTNKGVNLWDVVPKAEVLPPNRLVVSESARATNLAKYISQGFGFESPDSQSDDTAPQDEGDEWEKFFAVDTQLVGGRCRRKGGVKSHSSFEGFVDSSQS